MVGRADRRRCDQQEHATGGGRAKRPCRVESGRDEVRRSYGARADEYTALLGSVEALSPIDRETITDWGRSIDGPIVDAGCGPGHWTQHLRDLGATVEGVEMVPEFVAGARARFPAVSFRLGLIDALPVATDGLAGLLAWFSVIHTVPDAVPGVLAEFARCLAPGGLLLLGFFAGERVEPFDHAVVTAYYWPVAEMGRMLDSAGFDVVQVRTRTEPAGRPVAAVTAELRRPRPGAPRARDA